MTTRILFIDDSGKPDLNHASGTVVMAGFSIPSTAVPTLSRRLLGATPVTPHPEASRRRGGSKPYLLTF